MLGGWKCTAVSEAAGTLSGLLFFTGDEDVVFISHLSTCISTAPFCALLWKEASTNRERGSHQITTVSYRGPIFPRDPLPRVVSTRPAEAELQYNG